MKIFKLLLLVLAATLFAGCGDEKDPIPEPVVDTTPVRTVLVYAVSENSLGSSMYIGADLDEMLEGVRKSQNMTANDNLLLYVDDTKLPRFYNLTIAEKDQTTKLSEMVPEFQYSEDTYSTTPEQLKNVMDYMIKNHRADSYGIVFASHGSGWIGSWNETEAKKRQSMRKTFGLDNGNNVQSDYGVEMEIADMAKVLSNYPKLDFIFFDVCFMQCIEVDYALRNVADYIVASPAEIPAYGGYYTDLVDNMFVGGEEGAKSLPKKYVQYYTLHTSFGGALLSTIKTSQLESFAEYMKKVVDAHRDDLMKVEVDGTDMDYFNYDKFTINDYPDYYDIQLLMKKVLSDAEYAEYQTEIDKVIVAKACNDFWWTVFGASYIRDVKTEQYGGASMFVPQEKYANDSADYLTQFAKTEWGKKVWGGAK